MFSVTSQNKSTMATFLAHAVSTDRAIALTRNLDPPTSTLEIRMR